MLIIDSGLLLGHPVHKNITDWEPYFSDLSVI